MDAIDESATDAVPLTLQTFGAARIMLGDQTLGMHNALLFMLVLRMAYAPSMAVRRDTVLEEFWPDQDEVRQRGNLRQALYKLRTLGVKAALRGDVIQLDAIQVQRTFSLAPSLEHFERDITRGTEPYGTFLPDITPPTPALCEWIERTREAMHGAVRRVLVEVLRLRRERADWKGTQVVAQWLLQLDPLNEDGTLALAECAALTGSKAEAVAILDRYLADLGPGAGDIRLPATLLRKRFAEAPQRRRSVALVTDKCFVGRDADLSAMTMSLRRARWHDGSAVLLYGPPGMGKSRVVAEMVKVAQFEGYHDVVIECRESINARPLGALIEVLPELLTSPGAMGCAPESLTVLRKLLAPDSVRGDERPEEPPTPDAMAALTPTERIELAIRTMRAQSIRHAVVDLFAAVSDERPIFLLVEDVHWLDDASWEVLSDVMQRVNEMRVYVVLTSRFATIMEERPSRVPTPLTYRKLAPLDGDALSAMIRAVADDHGLVVADDVVRWIIAGCEGNPLMLRALLEHWAVTGRADGVPPSLSSLIDQRLDRLDGHAQQALQATSLLGAFATLERIKLVLELPMHVLISAIEQLEMSDSLLVSQASLVITHSLVQDVAIRRMPPLVQQALRSSIADNLEAEFAKSGDLAILLESLSHTELSGRPKVLHNFFLNHHEALVLGDRPSTILRALGTLYAQIPKTKGERQLTRIQLNQESKNYEWGKALSLVSSSVVLPSDPRSLGESEVDECLSYVEAAYRSLPIADPISLSVFAAAIASNPDAKIRDRIRAADVGLTIASNTCDLEVARRCYLGLELSEADIQDDERTQKVALMYHTVFGSVDTAVRIAEQLVRRNEDCRPTAQQVIEYGRAGYVFRMTGKQESARRAFEKAREVAREIDAPRHLEYPTWQLAQLALEAGEVSTAERWTAELEKLASLNNDDAANAFIHSHLCLMAITNGKRQAAEAHLSKVLRPTAARKPLRTLAYSVGLKLGVGLLDRKWTPSDALMESAILRFEDSSGFCASDFLASRIGNAMLRLGRVAEAQALIGEYITKKRREQAAPSAFLKPLLIKLNLR
jgi:DNA-binding SARP family transcriptional activator/tetratricopeptide (TPR) repeat protein